MKPVSLEAWQADFAAALLSAGAASPGTAIGTYPAQWLALYRSHVHAASAKALGKVFPVVRALVGDECFGGLARAYARAHPSSSGDLNAFGAHLSIFLQTFEPALGLPYLGDVAALEWLVHRAHAAADARTLPRERAAVMQPQELLAARFVLHPACAWMQSSFPIATIWRAHQPDSHVVLPESLERSEWALIARPDWRAKVVESSAAEIAALAMLRNGGAMDDAIGAALEQDAKFDFARGFVRWLDLELLVINPSL